MAVDADSANYRIEHDTMGEVRVPAKRCGARKPSARWRTSRYPAAGWSAQIRALGLLKAPARR